MFAIGKAPITRLIAVPMTVARLSVITTESDKSPDCLPSGVESEINTRLG